MTTWKKLTINALGLELFNNDRHMQTEHFLMFITFTTISCV